MLTSTYTKLPNLLRVWYHNTMRYKNYLGFIFNKLTVLKFIEIRNGHAYWFCKCDCGNKVIVRGSHLKENNIKSCGCFLKGIPKTKEHRKKISNTLTNLPRMSPTEETRKKIGDAQRGEKHWNWKGGLTNKNIQLRNTIEYKKWRNEIYKRDKYTCQICKVKGGKLNADHIKRFADYPELRFELSNGRTLCIDCHKKTDTYKNKKQHAPSPTTK